MKPRAFTLIEMLLSIAIIAILAAIMTPIFLSFQTRNDVDIASMALTRSIRRAQQLARNGEGDSTWGVNLSSGAITVFKGSSYASRDANYDEIFSIPNNISLTGTSSMVFSKMYGMPSVSSTVTLVSVNNETRTVSVNAKGLVIATGSSSSFDPSLPNVTLSVAPTSIAEAAGTATLTATLSGTSASNVIVNLSYSGTATLTSDYTGPSSITITAGSLTGTATLTAVQDAVSEGNETIITDISSVSGANEFGTQQVNVAVVDDEPAPFICGINQVTVTSTAEHICSEAAPYYDKCTYDTVAIGTQCWLKQNMNVGNFLYSSSYQTNNSSLEKFCYNESYSNCQTYGGLYEFNESLKYNAVEGSQGICPTGWHIPTDAEWTALTSYLTANGQSGTEGTALKSTSPSWDGTNAFGFSAIPAGQLNGSWAFVDLSTAAYFRSSTIDSGSYSWNRTLSSGTATISRTSNYFPLGFSVRCVYNQPVASGTVTLSVAPTSIAEAAGTATLTATLSNALASNVIVNLSYSGTATLTSDYTGPSSITITAGSLTGTATLTAVQDTTYEGDETIITDISSVSGANEFGTQQVTVTINDDDAAPFICGTSQVVVTSVGGHTCNEAFPDYDKCTYDTVSVGGQCWMKQNMNIGTRINGYNAYQTNNSILEKFCYSETTGYCQSGGGLYEFNEAKQYSTEGAQGICPTGWHIPTDAEWTTMISYLMANGYSGTEATALKAVSPTWDGTDNFGFNLLPVGYFNSSYSYVSLNSASYLWSSTLDGSYGWYRNMASSASGIGRASYSLTAGLSVRCLKN